MIAQVKPTKQYKDPEYFIHPTKFVLWLLITASVMLFAAFTSAYIVRRGEGNWFMFELPSLFRINTIIVALSSVCMQWAYLSAKKDELNQLKIAISLTFLLGLAFVVGQWFAYGQLIDRNIFLSGTPSESFVYIISFVHLVHIIGGLLFVGVIAFRSFGFNVHKKNMLGINLCTTYWHFVGALWIYLYFFFQLNR